MKNKSTLTEEIRQILKKENPKGYMDEHASKLYHRLTPMMVGIFLDNIDRKTIDTWL